MKKEHGEHNKKLCDELYVGQKYPDWVITTAFYSAIHYIDHKIFPFDHKGAEVKNLETALKHTDLKRGGRHETRAHLVSLKLPNQKVNFKYLMQNCQHARYNNYKVDPKLVENCRLFLESLIAECTNSGSLERNIS